MKTMNKWMWAVTLLFGLASCEMKDEILGKDPMTGDTGTLSLSVETGKVTRGTTDQVDQFPVVITGKDVEYTKKFDSYAELKQAGEVKLPVGTYTIEACSPGEFESTMSEPFYGGEQEVKIQKDVTSETSVVCTMQNVKISINLTEEFLATYDDWEFTVTDGNEHVQPYTKTADGNKPAAVYWKMEEGVELIYVKGKAHTISGEEVTFSEIIRKSGTPEFEEGDDPSLVGGDELKIDFLPVKVEGSTPGIEKDGIQIKVSLFNSEKDENVEIPVNPGTDGGDTEEPGTGEDGGDEGEDGDGETNSITISDNGTGYLTNGVTIEGDNYPTDVKVIMDVPNGIQNVYVKVESSNDYFTNAAGLMGLTNGDGMDLTSDKAKELSDYFPLPNQGAPEYSFSMTTSLFQMLGSYKGKHDFILKVVDSNGNSESAVLTINI